jgi:putative transposase
MGIKLDPLSFRDVEHLLAERGIMVSYETLRRWVTISGRWSQRTCANARREAPPPKECAT